MKSIYCRCSTLFFSSINLLFLMGRLIEKRMKRESLAAKDSSTGLLCLLVHWVGYGLPSSQWLRPKEANKDKKASQLKS